MLKYHFVLLLLVWGAGLLADYTNSGWGKAVFGILLFLSVGASIWGLSVVIINLHREQLVWGPEPDRSREICLHVVVGLLSGVAASLTFRRESFLAHLTFGSVMFGNLGLWWSWADYSVRSVVLSDSPPRRSGVPLIGLQKGQVEEALDQLGAVWGFRRLEGKFFSLR